MFKFLATAVVLINGGLYCAKSENAEASPPSGLLAEDDVPDDEVTLLQSQVEVKKGEAKTAKQAADAEVQEKATYTSATSCESSEKVTQPHQQKQEAEPSTLMQTADGAEKAENASILTLGSVLQAMALLLIVDVVRRCPWKDTDGVQAKPASSTSPTLSDPAEFRKAVLAGDVATFDAYHINNYHSSQLSQVDSWGCSVLHYAAKGGSIHIIKKLLDLGALVNAIDAWDETPLHTAARAGNANACETLLEAGAEIDATNAEDCTPLVIAGRAEQEATCRMLIGHGAGIAELPADRVPELVRGLLLEQVPTEVPLGYCPSESEA